MWMKYAIATDSMMIASSDEEGGGGEQAEADAAGLDADLELGLGQRDLAADQAEMSRLASATSLPIVGSSWLRASGSSHGLLACVVVGARAYAAKPAEVGAPLRCARLRRPQDQRREQGGDQRADQHRGLRRLDLAPASNDRSATSSETVKPTPASTATPTRSRQAEVGVRARRG